MTERRLNVGCGQFPEPGWTNIDRHGSEGMPDARPRDGAPVLDIDLFDIDPQDGRYALIYCGHSLEHIDLRRLGDAAHALAALLEPGGELCVVGPDLIHAGPSRTPKLAVGTYRGARLNLTAFGKVQPALTMAGLAVQRARPEDMPDVWPVVCRTDPTQFALLARHP